MKVTIAYIEEPPFGWTEGNSIATGADIDLAEVVLRAIGATVIEHRLTTFGELLPGVEAGRWDMNVPLFVTPERANLVAFSVPVWAMRDGFLVRTGNPKSLDSYASVAKRSDARLGIIAGQVQHDSARAFRVGKRGSMSTPTQVLGEFRTELREKSRVRIERPDLPEGDSQPVHWWRCNGASASDLCVLIQVRPLSHRSSGRLLCGWQSNNA